jgi:hypothetical protein
MAVCCQNLTLGALNSRSALSLCCLARYLKSSVSFWTRLLYWCKWMITEAKHGMINRNCEIRNFVVTLLGAMKSRRIKWAWRVGHVSEWESSTQLCITISSNTCLVELMGVSYEIILQNILEVWELDLPGLARAVAAVVGTGMNFVFYKRGVNFAGLAKPSLRRRT